MEKAQAAVPHLAINYAEATRREDVANNTWFIVKKGLPKSEGYSPSEVLIDSVPCAEGKKRLMQRIRALEKEHGLKYIPVNPAPKAA